MGDFIHELNIIDFLGILLPGSSTLLLINYSKIHQLTGLEFTAADVVLLLVGGYILGTLLHELWDFLEKLLWRIEILDPKIYAAKVVNEESKDLKNNFQAYAIEMFGNDSEKLKQIKSNAEGNQNGSQQGSSARESWLQKQIKKYKEYAWIQEVNPMLQTQMVGRGNFSKRTVFDGFHVMMRNLLFTLLLISGCALVMGRENPMLAFLCEYIENTGEAVGLLVVICLLMGFRSVHYAYLKYKYTYENFTAWRRKAAQKKASPLAPPQAI